MQFQIKKAERTKVKLKLAIEGPSGSGKTHSSLIIAQGLVPGGKVLVVDTENGSASLFSNLYDFYVIDFAPPYTPERYREAIQMAVAEKFDTLIIDSGSHEWSGKGGCLEIHDKMPGNTWTNWAAVTPRHDAFVTDMLRAPIHIIMTLRSKEKYIQEDINGKQKIRKAGAEAIQRDGLAYEFSVVLTMDISHQATSTKDRTGLFPVDHWHTPTVETGRKLAAWLAMGVDAPIEPAAIPPRDTSKVQKTSQTPPQGNGTANKIKGLYNGYLEICTHQAHAKNAMLLVTEGRMSKDWTETDLANLEADLERRRAEQLVLASVPPVPPVTPEEEPEVVFLASADLAEAKGIGPDSPPEPNPPESHINNMAQTRTEAGKLRGQVERLFREELGWTEPELLRWLRDKFVVRGLRQLPKEKLKLALSMGKKLLADRDAKELGAA